MSDKTPKYPAAASFHPLARVVDAEKYEQLERELTEARERLAKLMIQNSFATGHGDSIDNLLTELEPQIADLRARLRTAIGAE